MVKKEVVLQLDRGLETRPVAMLVQVASRYQSEIHLNTEDDRSINAKSIMGMMTLGMSAGEKVTVTASGPDETEALDEIEAFLTRHELNS